MPINPDDIKFNNPEEFRELCHAISMRLHWVNRVAMGESRLTWEIAELFNQIGRILDEADADLHTQFGNGYEAGTLTKEAQRERLIALLFPDNRP